MKIFAIFDKKAQAYEMSTLPLFANYEIAKRSFSIALQSNALGAVISHNPEDFDVYCIGDFDQKTGELYQETEFVCNIVDLLPKKEEANNG